MGIFLRYISIYGSWITFNGIRKKL